VTCPVCHRPEATPTDESLWVAHQAGAPLPEGWPSEDAEHLCWYALHRSGCTPNEKSDPVSVARRLIDEGADGAVLLVARAVVRLSAVLDAEGGVKGLDGWRWDPDDSRWTMDTHAGTRLAMAYAGSQGIFMVRNDGFKTHACTDALDGMERAEEMIRGASER
jgi:hypothetical protein